MRLRHRLAIGAVSVAVVACVAAAVWRIRAVDLKARGLRAEMPLREVLEHMDGWRMINAHPRDRRAIPHGTGPEFNGYSGDRYVLTPVEPDGRETDLRKISRAEFVARLEQLVGDGEPWIVYFNYRALPTDRGILVQFNGQGRIASDGR
jgi:hypothetical protein